MNKLSAFLAGAVLCAAAIPSHAQALQCGMGQLTVSAAGKGNVNGLQTTVVLPSATVVVCPDPGDPGCQVEPVGPLGNTQIFQVNAQTAGQVRVAVAHSVNGTFPAPAPAVVEISFYYLGELPDLEDFAMPEGYFTDLDGFELGSAQPILAGVTPTGSAQCPQEMFPGSG